MRKIYSLLIILAISFMAHGQQSSFIEILASEADFNTKSQQNEHTQASAQEIANLKKPNIFPAEASPSTRTVYHMQDFEGAFTGAPAAPTGWTQSRFVLLGTGTPNANGVDGEKDWQQNTNTGPATWTYQGWSSGIRPSSAVSGTGVLYFEDAYFGSTTTWLGSRRLESPSINLNSSTNPYVRLFFFYNRTSEFFNVRVMASADGGTTWNSIMVLPANATSTTAMSSTTPWQRINVSIPPAYRTANAKFGIETTNTYGTNEIWIDDFSVEEFTPTTITSAATGNWSDAATWVGGIVPSSDNHVVIATGHTVTINVNIARCQDLTINGTLAHGTTANHLLHVFGNLTVNAGGTLNVFNGTVGRRVYVGQNFTNNGTANFSVGAGLLVWVGGSPASFSGSGTFTNSRINNIWHFNSGGVTYNSPITVVGTFSLLNGVVNPNGNLTLGNSVVSATQTIERTSQGSLASQPIWGAGVNRSLTYTTLNNVPPSKQLFTTGHEIRQDAGIGYVEGTLTINTHDNIQLGYPAVLGTAALGTLTLSRGILVTTDANLLTLSNFVAGATGTAQTIATAPATHITNHGSYIAGPLRINFPTANFTTRNFPLGVGTGFAGTARNENNLKTMTFSSSTNWTGSTVKVSLVGPLSGTANAPLTQVIPTRGWYVDLLGGADLPANTTVTIRGRNNTGGNSDNLAGEQSELRVAQATALTGPWTQRSTASGTGAILDNTEYLRTTSVAAPGPIAPIGTQGAYFGFATTMTAANPTGVTATAAGQTQINIAFTPNTASNPVLIVFNQTGVFTDPTGAPPAVGQAFAGGTLLYNGQGSSFTHTGLSGATTYFYRLFSYNAPLYSSGVSVNATTECPVFSTFPIAQGFESVAFPPTCWTVAQVSGTGLWEGTATGANPTVAPQEGTRMAQFRSFTWSTGASSILVSPAINFPNANYRVNFWMFRDGSNYLTNADRVIVHYNTSPNLTGATALGTVHRSISLAPVVNASGWNNYIFNLPSGASGNGFIIFEAISGYGNNIFIDNAIIEQLPPPCVVPGAQPTALNLTATSNSVNGSFTASPSANGYLVVRHTSATLGGTPVNNTIYAPGASIGSGTVVASGTTTEFSSTALESSTQYFFFVFAYSLSPSCTGPVYRTAAPLTANVTTGPAAPASLVATPTSATAIAFTATPNTNGNTILVAWNTTNTFGTPSGAMSPGQSITGGGTVHYVGNASGLFPHTGLNPATQYFYRAWSVTTGPTYSSTFVNANATTLFGTPYTQNFDTSPTGATLPSGWVSYASRTGTDARPWTISNNVNIGNVTPSNFVGVFYHSSFAKNEWMVSPGIQLTAGQPYLVRFFVRAPGWAGTPEKMKVTVAGSNTLAAISAGTVIWNNPNMLISAYQEQTISFTPTTSGAYYFGWHAYSAADIDFIAVDNIRIDEQPAFQFTPENFNFQQVYSGLQSVPQTFTLKNNRTTPITVSSVGFTGANADQFIKQDANSYPLTIPAGGTATVNVVFKPTSVGVKNANLQVIDNHSTWTAALTGTGYVHSPQNLTATAVAPTHVQLNWDAPIFPANEIRFDDNTVESWLLVSTPSALTHMISHRITIPQNGQLTHISILSRLDAAGSVNWENIMLCPATGGNPNLAAPIQAFSNVPITSTVGQWNIFQLTTPLNVTAGQTFFIVGQWPAGSTTGPRIGNDTGFGFGRSQWTNDSGSTWNNWSGNFMMRAYMSTGRAGELVLKSGDANPALADLPVINLSDRVSESTRYAFVESGIEAPSIIASGEATEGKSPTGYIVRRGTTAGVYNTEFNVSGTSYLDETTVGATSYFYRVAAVYANGEGQSNEVQVNTLCTTLPIPYVQNFDNASFPICWTQTFSGALTSNRWTVANASNAGGTPYEMRATWQNNVGVSRLISPAFNTTGESILTLRFRSRIDDFGIGATLKIQTSADGITWTDEQWFYNTAGNVTLPAEIITTSLFNNIGSTTYIAWVIEGNHNQFDFWDIDEVQISAGLTVTATSQNLSCFGANNGSIDLSIIGGVPPYSFLWVGPDGFTSTDQNISGLAAGTYNYTVFDASTPPAQVSNQVILTQPAEIAAPTTANITAVYDATQKTITAVAAPGTDLVWYDAATGGNVTVAPSASNAGIYTAWAVSKNTTTGCESIRVQATLTIQKKQLTVTASSYTICQSDALPTLEFAYSGFVTDEGPANLEAPVMASTNAVAGGAPGVYPITLAGGVSNNYSFVYVNGSVTIIASPVVNAGGNGAVCTSEQFPIVAATASNFTTIVWTTSGNGTFSNTGIVNPVYTPGSQDIANGTVVLTITADPTSQCSATSSMTLTLQNDLPVSVVISQTTPQLCVGTPVSFAALPTNGGLSPSFQWKVNGNNAGTNSPNFTYVPVNGDIVTVVLTSSIGCALNNPATSNAIVVNVTPDLTAGVNITASATEVCDFTPVTFTAIPVNGGMNPSYQWKVNGLNAGTNSATFTFAPLNGDVITVVMTSNHPCAVVPIATSNAITMTVAQPLLVLQAQPLNGGTVAGGGNYAEGALAALTATPSPGWEFVHWKNMSGVVVSTNPQFQFTINQCYEMLTAVFSSTAKIAGQLKYFNAAESIVPSPNSNSVFYVQLFEGNVAVSERQLVKYNFETGLDSYFEFIGAESAKSYTLRIWEQATNNLLSNTWTWNNWGGATSIDALIISYMIAENPLLTSLPWIAPVAVPNYTPLFSKVADVNNSGGLSGADPLVLQYRITNTPGFHPLPGGAHNFQLATTKLSAHTQKSYPDAPAVMFASTGNFAAGTVASELYYEAPITGLSDGLNVFNVYFVATGDLNASYVPGTAGKSSVNLNYESVIAAKSGEEVLIPVRINQSAEVGAITLGFKYNKQLIHVTEVLGYQIYHIDHNEGAVRIAWMSENGRTISQNENVVVLKAKILNEINHGTRFIELLPITEFADKNATVIPSVGLSTNYIETGITSIGDLNDLSISHTIFPNPFKDASTIRYTLPEAGKVRIAVYNHIGQEVKTLVEEIQQAGAQQLMLHTHDLRDAGTYFYRITLESDNRSYQARGSVVLVK